MIIPLTQGLTAIIDDDDFSKVQGFKWHARKSGRDQKVFMARAHIPGAGHPYPKIYMHHLIMNPIEGFMVRHMNGNFLDNRKDNLKICSCKDSNRAKKLKSVKATSKFRGVCFASKKNKWQAQITVSQKNIFLGRFNTGEEAAKAYDAACKKYYGVFACPNFP